MCTLFKPENQATNINSKKEEEGFMKTFFSQEANCNYMINKATEIVDGVKEMCDRNLRENVENWVRTLSAIPQQLIEKAYLVNDSEELIEITPPTINDRVYHFSERRDGEIVDITEDGKWIVKFDNGEKIESELSDFEVERFYNLPIWGTMWSFQYWGANEWIREPKNLQKMADCGFRIYESEDGIFFGIDGCGYDFYKYHWIPFYKAYVLGE